MHNVELFPKLHAYNTLHYWFRICYTIVISIYGITGTGTPHLNFFIKYTIGVGTGGRGKGGLHPPNILGGGAAHPLIQAYAIQ